jgi:hypothetical protein
VMVKQLSIKVQNTTFFKYSLGFQHAGQTMAHFLYC